MQLPSSEFPDNPVALAQFIKGSYSLLQNLKVNGVGDRRSWLYRLGDAICAVGLREEQLSADHLGAAIFAVNGTFHKGVCGAENMKTRLQRMLILRSAKRRDRKVTFIPHGRYANTYLLQVGPWETHVLAQLYESVTQTSRPNHPPTRKRYHGKRPARGFRAAYAH